MKCHNLFLSYQSIDIRYSDTLLKSNLIFVHSKRAIKSVNSRMRKSAIVHRHTFIGIQILGELSSEKKINIFCSDSSMIFVVVVSLFIWIDRYKRLKVSKLKFIFFSIWQQFKNHHVRHYRWYWYQRKGKLKKNIVFYVIWINFFLHFDVVFVKRSTSFVIFHCQNVCLFSYC